MRTSRPTKSRLLGIARLFAWCLALAGCGGPDLLVRVDQPLTLAEAQQRGETDFPFPPSAHDIYYGTYGDWQASESLIRFDAPPEDCKAAIERVLAWHGTRLRSSKGYQPRSFSGSLPDSSWLHPVSWFDGAVLGRGLFAGEDASHAPNIWVDLDAGRFFYRSTD